MKEWNCLDLGFAGFGVLEGVLGFGRDWEEGRGGIFIESVIKFASIFSRKLPINHHFIYKLE